MPKIWDIKLTLDFDLEADMTDFVNLFPIHSTVSDHPIILQFGMDQNGETNGDITADITARVVQNAKMEGKPLYDAEGEVENARDYSEAQMTGARKIDFKDPLLNLPGMANDQPDKTFAVELQFVHPMPVKYTMHTDIIPPPPETSLPNGIQGRYDMKYDYAKLQNAGSAKVKIPDEFFKHMTIKKVKATAQFEIRRPEMKMTYAPNLWNQIGMPDVPMGTTAGWVHISDNLSRDSQGGSLFIHGNNRISLLLNGEDVSTYFNTARLMRVWEVKINTSGKVTGSYNLLNPFADDALGNRASWGDVPGERLLKDPAPDKWPLERYLEEFLVAVKGFPEFGFLYFIMAVDRKPGFFRVCEPPGKNITYQQWQKIKQSKSPWKTAMPNEKGEPWQPAPLE